MTVHADIGQILTGSDPARPLLQGPNRTGEAFSKPCRKPHTDQGDEHQHRRKNHVNLSAQLQQWLLRHPDIQGPDRVTPQVAERLIGCEIAGVEYKGRSDPGGAARDGRKHLFRHQGSDGRFSLPIQHAGGNPDVIQKYGDIAAIAYVCFAALEYNLRDAVNQTVVAVQQHPAIDDPGHAAVGRQHRSCGDLEQSAFLGLLCVGAGMGRGFDRQAHQGGQQGVFTLSLGRREQHDATAGCPLEGIGDQFFSLAGVAGNRGIGCAVAHKSVPVDHGQEAQAFISENTLQWGDQGIRGRMGEGGGQLRRLTGQADDIGEAGQVGQEYFVGRIEVGRDNLQGLTGEAGSDNRGADHPADDDGCQQRHQSGDRQFEAN